MTADLAIHWFRNDLRLVDNPALLQAAGHGQVLPIYILDEENAGEYAMGSASRWWLHHSLMALNSDLGGALSLYRGDPLTILQSLIERLPVRAVYWNRCYEPWRIQRDMRIKKTLQQQNIAVESHNGSLLWEPWTVSKQDGTPYKVFTPYYRRGCLAGVPPRSPLDAPRQVQWYQDDTAAGIAALELLPSIRWDEQLEPHWQIGEHAAHARLAAFLDEGLFNYREGRDFPAKNQTSKLSAHLHFGEISPHQVWHTLDSVADSDDTDHFRSELGWREFSSYLLFHNPGLPRENLRQKFTHFPWEKDPLSQQAWQKGKTGIPLVDAGMRELWQTGYMHNRVRMIVGSFLVKNLRLHWHEGARWFWDCLVDADLASNSASWQWIAGCGSDAVPYFRIFNPVTQGKKFDPEGSYIRRYVPEIAVLPDKYLFSPWTAPKSVLQAANITLGKTYPEPLVDLQISRKLALAAFHSLQEDPPIKSKDMPLW
ncbi:MAG: deoxyribodipyrimidine photolyase [Desulfobulbus propionicus]|nr:MAG: deoxyribodipyrimidine photolyase [Desulfobulbus propionicus]